jgi:hypothetical protein
MLSVKTKCVSPNKQARSKSLARLRKTPVGKHTLLHYTYRDLRDIPINQLTEDQFRYVVKTLLEASTCKNCSEVEEPYGY